MSVRNWMVGCGVIVLAAIAGPKLLSHGNDTVEPIQEIQGEYTVTNESLNFQQKRLEVVTKALKVEGQEIETQFRALTRETNDLQAALLNVKETASHLGQEVELYISRCTGSSSDEELIRSCDRSRAELESQQVAVKDQLDALKTQNTSLSLRREVHDWRVRILQKRLLMLQKEEEKLYKKTS